MSNLQSRRSFVKAAGAPLFIAGIAGMGLAHVGQGVAGEAEGFQWDEETDVLVVGAGLAGMCAAITVAREGNGATCTLLEKGGSSFGNGNSPFSSGVLMYTEPEKKEEDVFEYLKELRHDDVNGTPDDVLAAFAKEICQNLPWMRELGVTDEDIAYQPATVRIACLPEYPELEHSMSIDYLTVNVGRWNHAVMFISDYLDTCEAVTLKTDSRLTALVQDPETKAILGGVYTNEGKEIRIKANKGVIMTCGGYENNQAMTANYYSQPTIMPIAGRQNTGDGHAICAKLGVAEWHMNCGAGFWNNLCKLDDSAFGAYSGYGNPVKEMGITVGKNGRRFYADWDACTSCDWEAVEAGVPLEAAVGSRHGHMQFGGDWHLLPMPEISWFICDQAAIDNGAYARQGEDPVAEGFGYKADTLEELAEMAGLPADELVKSVANWNTFCENGEDIAFYRSPSTLNPVATAPFYAIKLRPQLLNTDGGPVRDAKGRIIDIEGNPIPRLYSAGEFGSVWSGHYQAAGNLTECMSFGRISARSALNEE